MNTIRRVLVAGVWDQGPGYPRTGSLLAALDALGLEVETCRVDPVGFRGSKSELISRPWRWPGYLLSSRRTRTRLRSALQRQLVSFEPDLVLVPYPGHLAVRWIRSLCSQPIWLDLFLSAWSTTVDDRGLFSPKSLAARALLRLDREACRAADRVLLDTRAHAADVSQRTGLAPARFGHVPICDPELSAATPMPAKDDGVLRCLFFGTGVPLHGLETWIDAVQQVENVHWTLIGGDAEGRRRAHELLGDRVDLRPEFVPMAEVREAIERSHLVCGAVGTSNKAQQVVPFKVVHGLAHGRLVLTGDNASVREMLEPGQDCLTTPVGSVERLASVLEFAAGLNRDELQRFGTAARRRFENGFSVAALARALERELDSAGLCLQSRESAVDAPCEAEEPVS